MSIQAKDAEAGRRYQCVDTGDVVEICAKPGAIRNGKLIPLTSRDGTFIYVIPISHENKKLKARNPEEMLGLPAFYQLSPYDGPYLKPPKKRIVPEKKPSKPGRKGGRPTKGDIPWRGWAAAARHDMEALLEIIEAEGFWLGDTTHYYSVGFKSKICMGVFKSGQLGFHARPEGVLGDLPAKKPTSDPYMPWKVELGPVMASDRWQDMVETLRRYLRDFKKRIEAGHRPRR